MELTKRTHKASKFAPEGLDFISNMPDNVVTNILDRLPVEDAVRTGILSRNWRFKWNMVSQLLFYDVFFLRLVDLKGEKDPGRIVSRLLFNIKGTITKFLLFFDEQRYFLNVDDISHWILFLSRKGVKDLTILKRNTALFKLPTHVFSCLELKHLELINCCFDPPASFNGFPNLLSFKFRWGEFESGKFGELLTRCPKLEILGLNLTFPGGKVKLVEIAKLTNLRILSLPLCNLDTTRTSIIFELAGFLPKLQELDLDFDNCKLTYDVAKKRLPITFPCLKTLSLSEIDLGDDSMLSYVIEMIRSFPNLHTLHFKAKNQDAVQPPAICSLEVDYGTMRSLQLRYVLFGCCKASENDIGLIKYLLACCPFLKKMIILSLGNLASNEKFMFSRKLLKLYRASPLVDIDLY